MARILVADDDQGVLDYVVQVLEEEGFQVTTVESGENALEELRANQYDLFLTDQVMDELQGTGVMGVVIGLLEMSAKKVFGEGLEGYEEFKECYDGLPMILMTRKLSQFDINRVERMGGRDAINKVEGHPPLNRDELVEKVQKYLPE